MVNVCFPLALYNRVTPQLDPSNPSSQILNHPNPVTDVCVASGILEAWSLVNTFKTTCLAHLLGHVSHHWSRVTRINGVRRVGSVVAVRLEYVMPLGGELSTSWYVDDDLAVRGDERVWTTVTDDVVAGHIGDRPIIL